MGLPQMPQARLYYRAAKQRFDEAQLLLDAGHTTGAVYLAGYTVECLLKALVLSSVARRLRNEILGVFRGTRAHNIEWLVSLYRRHTGAAIPREVSRHLSRVTAWSTDLRYTTERLKGRDADEFMDSVIAISAWADGRM